jgi:putative transcriptional regulator
MIKYRFNVGDALERAGFNTYKAKTSGLLSQDTLKKIKNEDTNISAKSLNSLCLILDMQPKDIFIYEETAEDLEQKNKI